MFANDGDTPLTVSASIRGGDGVFSIVKTDLPRRLLPGQRATVEVKFTPQSVGEAHARVRFVVEPGGTSEVTLDGRGLPNPILAAKDPSISGPPVAKSPISTPAEPAPLGDPKAIADQIIAANARIANDVVTLGLGIIDTINKIRNSSRPKHPYDQEIKRGRAALKQKKWTEAEDAFINAIGAAAMKTPPDGFTSTFYTDPAYRELANALAGQARWQEAEVVLHEMRAFGSDERAILANTLLQQGKYVAAYSEFDSTVSYTREQLAAIKPGTKDAAKSIASGQGLLNERIHGRDSALSRYISDEQTQKRPCDLDYALYEADDKYAAPVGCREFRDALIAGKHWQAAEGITRQMAERDDDFEPLGDVLSALQRGNEAIGAYRRALSAHDRAQQPVRKALDSDPVNELFKRDFARIEGDRDRVREKLKQLGESITESSEPATPADGAQTARTDPPSPPAQTLEPPFDLAGVWSCEWLPLEDLSFSIRLTIRREGNQFTGTETSTSRWSARVPAFSRPPDETEVAEWRFVIIGPREVMGSTPKSAAYADGLSTKLVFRSEDELQFKVCTMRRVR